MNNYHPVLRHLYVVGFLFAYCVGTAQNVPLDTISLTNVKSSYPIVATTSDFIHSQACPQTTLITFHSPHFCLHLSDSGTYTMGPYWGNMPTLGYKSQDTISFGNYKKQGRFYILDADKSIAANQGDCTDYSVEYATSLQKDSLIIFINSPYEEMLKRSNLVRIYRYLLTVHCSDGSVFSIMDSTNRISIFLNSPLQISKVDIMIYYRPDFYSLSDAYSFTHSPYCHICLNNIPLDSNRITITMPNFKYFSLTYLPYRNYKVKIINRHNILANGELWHRYDMKYKMKSGRRNRKLQRHPEL